MLLATANATASRVWRVAVLVTTLTSVFFSLLNEVLGLPGESIARVSELYPTLFTPAGYAFSIWSLIYAANIAYAAFALRDSERSVRMHDRVAPWLVLSNLLGPLWIVIFRQNAPLPAVLAIWANLAVATVLYFTVHAHVQIQRLNPLWRVPFALLVGWLFVASLANSAIALVALGFHGQPLPEAFWAVALLLGVGFVSRWVATHLLEGVIPLVIAWASVAIAAEAFERSAWVGWVAVLVGLFSAYLGGSLLARKALRRAPNSHRLRSHGLASP